MHAHSTARNGVRTSHEPRMPEEDQILTLKNGAQAPVRAALAECSSLRVLLRQHPHHFQVLLQLMNSDHAQERAREAALKQSIRFLRSSAYLEKDGGLRALVRDILESGYQVTPDGPVITQPFLLTTEEDKAAAERAERLLENWFADGLRQRSDDGNEQSPSKQR